MPARTFYRTLVLLLMVATATAAPAATFDVFGPRDYRRDTAQPAVVRETFTVQQTSASYVLRVVNGGAAGTFEKVTSAIVKLNGTEIIGAKDFTGKAPATIEKPVTVGASNELTIELRGNPGAGMTLSVVGEVEDDVPPEIAATTDPVLNANGWTHVPVTVTFACSDSMSAIASCSPPVTVDAEGVTNVEGRAVDAAGNAATIAVPVRIDRIAPAVALTAPQSGHAVAASTTSIDISGSFSDAASGVREVRCGPVAATISGTTFTCSAVLAPGTNAVPIAATDGAGHQSSVVLTVLRDTELPAVRIAAPLLDRTNEANVRVAGSVSDDDAIAGVKVNGSSVAVSGDEFETTVALVNGGNTIEVTATDRGGNTATQILQMTRFSVPRIAITAPADLATVRSATVNVTGTISEPATISVNGVAATVSGTTFSVANIPLAQGRTVLTASASTAAGGTATDSILVYRDSIPPRVAVRYPEEGATVYQSPIDVTGMIDDIVVGTINSGQARITVNGVAAEVSNRAFVARGVPLSAGLNTLSIVATDQGGNSVTLASRVTYAAAQGVAKIVAISGGDQTGSIGATLPQPLVVKLTQADGSPAVDRTVVWEVIENNGVVTDEGVSDRIVTTKTDAQGTASIRWTLGMRAGAGNHRVSAFAEGFAGKAEFSATARMGAATLLVVDSGNNQFGATGAALPRPLVAIAVDAGSNRVAGVPVQFTVNEGDGDFDGQQSITVTTDSDGRAIATPRLGSSPSRNLFIARLPGIDDAVGFVAQGRVAGPAAETRIHGVILDNTDLPVPGVSVRIDGTTLVAQADAQGQFTIEGAPVGYVKLVVDGSTAQRPGTWPMLEYAMFTIPGAVNTLEMPIYLLPIDVRRGLFVDEVTGGTLTMPELPGFSLTVAPGSATFPGGSRTGTVSVTLVHSDKMPMAPGFGQQPRFIVTIQPPGVHFDPPAAITFPNVDGLAPGQVTEMYSFDHDLGQFVSIGTASVSYDGALLRSDPGVGIIKGGWHCGGDPATAGTAAKCKECFKCENDKCIPDPGKQGAKCDGHDCKRCQGLSGCKPITNPNQPFSGSATGEQVPPSTPLPPNKHGEVKPEGIKIGYTARCDGSKWSVELLQIIGQYSYQVQLVDGQQEAPPANAFNFCDLVYSYQNLGLNGSKYYKLAAVQAHENEHAKMLGPSLAKAVPDIEKSVESMSIGIDEAKSVGEAVAKLKALANSGALDAAAGAWEIYYISENVFHHNTSPPGPSIQAEKNMVDPLWQSICADAPAFWGSCPHCP